MSKQEPTKPRGNNAVPPLDFTVEQAVVASVVPFILQVEGLNIPFRRATVRGGANRPATAAIDMLPVAGVLALRPRTHIRLFYLDTKLLGGDGVTYNLLFEGEVTSTGIRKDLYGISAQILCEDFTNYYNNAYLFAVNNQSPFNTSAYEMAVFSGGSGTGLSPDARLILNTPLSIDKGTVINTVQVGLGLAAGIRAAMSKTPSDTDEATRLAAGVVGAGGVRVMPYLNPLIGLLSALEYVGGSARAGTGNTVDTPGYPRAINPFFADAQQSLKIMQRICIFPDQRMSELSLRRLGDSYALGTIAGSLSGVASLNDLVKIFLNTVGYDSYPLLAPPFASNPFKDSTIASGYPGLAREGLPNVGMTGSAILSTIWKPKTYFLPPPKCNVLYPCQIKSFNFLRNYMAEPTRLRTKFSSLPPRGVSGYEVYPGEMAYYCPAAASPGNILGTLMASEATSSAEGMETYKNKTAAAYKQNPETASQIDSANWNTSRSYRGLISDPSRDIYETETGVLPIFNTLDYSTFGFINDLVRTSAEQGGGYVNTTNLTDEIKKNNVGEYLLAYGDYQLDVARTSSRTLQIECSFNPHVLVGFPGLMLDMTGGYMGEFSEVTHAISCESSGSCRTIVSVSHSRQYPVSWSNTDTISAVSHNTYNGILANDGFGVVDLPPQLSEHFAPSALEATYAALGSHTFTTGAIGPAINAELDKYFGLTNPIDQVNYVIAGTEKVTRRQGITTITNAASFSSYHSDSRYLAAQALANQINKLTVFSSGTDMTGIYSAMGPTKSAPIIGVGYTDRVLTEKK